jgi:hypothetical protein
VALILLFGSVAFVAYTQRAYLTGAAMSGKGGSPPPRVLQVDLYNGCGKNGMAAKFTSYLRSQGFDVVEMKNYKSFNVRQTLVVDRLGNIAAARRVAATLGLSDEHVIQQLNPENFVDVTVIIGADYSTLRSGN